jgi:hypothetical protein
MATEVTVHPTAPAENPSESHAPRELASICPRATAAAEPRRRTKPAAKTPSGVVFS